MRILRTTKPIPVKYLKTGADNGTYDVEKLIWLPGRSRPIRVPDTKAVGLTKRGAAGPPVVPRATKSPPPHHQGVGLYVPPGYNSRKKS